MLYVGANVAYHGVLSIEQIADPDNPNAATALMDRIFGPVGADVMTALGVCGGPTRRTTANELPW